MGNLELAGLVVLAVAVAVPFLGWLAGATLVLISEAWSAREKVIGLLLVPLGVAAFGGILGGLIGMPFGMGFLELAVVFFVLAGPAAAVYLGRRVRDRRSQALRHPEPVGAARS